VTQIADLIEEILSSRSELTSAQVCGQLAQHELRLRPSDVRQVLNADRRFLRRGEDRWRLATPKRLPTQVRPPSSSTSPRFDSADEVTAAAKDSRALEPEALAMASAVEREAAHCRSQSRARKIQLIEGVNTERATQRPVSSLRPGGGVARVALCCNVFDRTFDVSERLTAVAPPSPVG
jgi:hypothetical protein